MSVKKLTRKGILIPMLILIALGAAFVFVNSTLAAEKAAIDCHGWIYVKKAVEWNGATPDTEKEFEICVTKLPDTDMGCQVFTYQDVLDETEKGWSFSSTGTYRVWEVDPGIGWEWSVSGGSDIVISGDSTYHKTVTNTTRELDYGDLPDAYGLTMLSEDGPSHENGVLFLGGPPDGGVTTEFDGQPDPSALGDTKDDGVVPQGNWSNPSNGTLKVIVTGGPGCLFGWLDYTGGTEGFGGSFTADEVLLYNKPVVDGENIIPINEFENQIESVAIQGALTYARFRLLPQQTGGVCNYGGATDMLDMLTGAYLDGEVEDYYWPFGTNAVSMAGFSASSQGTPVLVIAGFGLLTLVALTTLAWRRRHMVVA